jgi:hypothetical protein
MRCQRIGLVLLVLALPASAHAHVAASATENNRYLKLTLLPDRVRFSYTVFFGDRPGAGERVRMDQNGNGVVDAPESARFGASLRDDVLGHLRLLVDDQPVPASAWKIEDVGLGTPETSAGAFAVDLLVYAPTGGAGAHSLLVEDGWSVPEPGETEIFVEESPGVRVVASHLAAAPNANQIRWTFRGNPEDPKARAVRVDWRVDDAAYAQAAASTDAAPPPPGKHRALWLALAAGAVGGLVLLWMTRKRARTTGTGTGTSR